MTFRFPAAVAAALILVATHPARAESSVEAFANAVKESTGDYNRAWVVTKLTTWKLGKKCAAKLADKDQGAIHAASFYAADIAEYAKALTGDDWSAIETANGNDHEGNKAQVEKLMDAFKARLSVSVSVEGDDCDAGANSLWLRYWGAVGAALRKYPPKATAVTVALVVTAKAKTVTVDVSKDAATFTITAPRDLESTDWSDHIEKPFRKLASELPDDFSFGVLDDTARYNAAWVLTKLTTFKVGKKCWAKLGDKNLDARHMAEFYVRDIAEYARAVGGDDWDAIEIQTVNDPATNRAIVAKDMDEFRSRLSVTVSVDGDDCDAAASSLWLHYWTTVATALRNHPPKARKVSILLKVVARAKDIKVAAGKDGATFTITAPRDVEPIGWSDKIDAAFKKVGRKP